MPLGAGGRTCTSTCSGFKADASAFVGLRRQTGARGRVRTGKDADFEAAMSPGCITRALVAPASAALAPAG